MLKKEVVGILGIFGILIALIMVSGCVRPGTGIACPSGQVMIDKVCCFDADHDNACDAEYCGDGVCKDDEDCATCWRDCGACKKIIYKYVPRKYALGELTDELRVIYDPEVSFKKDIVKASNVSNFYFYEKKLPRALGFFLSVDYRLLMYSKVILLSHIIYDRYYVNDTARLMDFLNYTRWYRIHDIISSARDGYSDRIYAGTAMDDYPAPPTGHEKDYRYSEWEFRNYTVKEDVLYDSISEIEPGIAEDIYASVDEYLITYRYNELWLERDAREGEIREAFKNVEEQGLNYVHTMNVVCSDNLVITVYEYDYKEERLTSDILEREVKRNRADLLITARKIKSMCERNYIDELFTSS